MSLATMKLENGHDVWWIPDVTNLPIAKLNDPKIPLVSTVIYMYIYERMRIRNKGRLNKIYREKSIPMTALWCPAFSNHG